MKKILLVFAFFNVLFFSFGEVSINETKISKENYARLAKCFKPEEFLEKVAENVKSSEEIDSSENDFALFSALASNAASYKVLYNIFRQQKSFANQQDKNELQKKQNDSEGEKTPFNLNAELLNIQNEFYLTVEKYNSLLEERFANQKKYVDYVFADSLDSSEEQIFLQLKDSVKVGFEIQESFEKIPECSLNEIYADFRENEISACEKWVGKRVRISAMVYSVTKMDMNIVFCITSYEKNEVPVVRVNSGAQIFANCYFNSENVEKLKKIKKKSQLTFAGVVQQDIARRPAFVDCKIVE